MLRQYFEGYADAIHLATLHRSRPSHEAPERREPVERSREAIGFWRLWPAVWRRIKRGPSP